MGRKVERPHSPIALASETLDTFETGRRAAVDRSLIVLWWPQHYMTTVAESFGCFSRRCCATEMYTWRRDFITPRSGVARAGHGSEDNSLLGAHKEGGVGQGQDEM